MITYIGVDTVVLLHLVTILSTPNFWSCIKMMLKTAKFLLNLHFFGLS